ncbi:hypothetical protein KGQ34_00720 [Patescibacteria group bacterium]|nr:hypothetical protein [Patescibacteria group bacterium]
MTGKLIAFIISEVSRPKHGSASAPMPAAKSAPHYFAKTVPQQFIVEEGTATVTGHEGKLTVRRYPNNFLLAELRFEVPDIFSEEIFSFKEEAIHYVRDILKQKDGKDVDEFSEEYTVFAVSDFSGEPEQFLRHKDRIAGLLKSEKLLLNPAEIEYTLSSQIKYGKDDLVIADWDGAFVFDPEGDVDAVVELLQLANLQLLKYRIMDRDLDARLSRISHIIEETPKRTRFFFTPREVQQALKETILLRSRSLSEFQSIEREIKLIGDWYSARLYDLVAKKFKLDEWRRAVKDKLDTLEDAYAIVSENFTISWEHKARLIEMFGWYVLLVGWLILLALDIYRFR